MVRGSCWVRVQAKLVGMPPFTLDTGEEWLDEVHLTPGITLTNQSIGAALIAIGFDGVNGVLG